MIDVSGSGNRIKLGISRDFIKRGNLMKSNYSIFMNNRIISLDVAKGLAIILLVFSHCYTSIDNIKTWIFSFHMPIFFVILGLIIFFKEQRGNLDINLKFIKKRSQQLLIPYFVFGIILLIFYQVLTFISGVGDILVAKAISLVSFQGIDSLWFIPVFLISEIIFLSLRKTLKTSIWYVFLLATFILLFLGMEYVEIKEMGTFWRMSEKVCIGLIFIFVGYCFAIIYSRINNPVLALVLIFIGTALSIYNGFVGIGSLEVNNPILFIINGSILSLGIILLSKTFEHYSSSKYFKLIVRFGAETIVVLCTNNLIIEIIRLIDYKVSGNWLLNHGILGAVVFSCMVLVIEFILISTYKRSRILHFALRGHTPPKLANAN